MLVAAVALWLGHARLISYRLPPSTVVALTIRSTVILAIGCAGVTFLLRRRTRSVNLFLLIWIAAYGAVLVLNVSRYFART